MPSRYLAVSLTPSPSHERLLNPLLVTIAIDLHKVKEVGGDGDAWGVSPFALSQKRRSLDTIESALPVTDARR